MKHSGACILFWIVCGSLTFARGASLSREDLGVKDKWRIVVDKVMQPEADWTTEEWMVREAAEADFNVYSPRTGHDDLEAVKQVTAWCEKYGIFHLPWMRGTLNAPKGEAADGKRVVWASGNEQPLWSVHSDAFWEWTHRYIVEYAKMSAENEHLIGVFLDYENYATGKEGNLYSLSYEDLILDQFAQSIQKDLPKLPLKERADWLKKEGLHKPFEAFQVEAWRKRCRALREAVDQYNPQFQFCIYPAPGTPFMVQAAYPEWATEKAPLILADACTYGRPSRFIPQEDGLRENKRKLLDRMKIAQEAGIPFMYSGGIDPVVKGADPEFCGKNAVAISEVTDGYWIFYEGPKYKEDHPDYWRWFTWANKAIKEGRYDVQYQPRETEEDWSLGTFGERFLLSSLQTQPLGETVTYPTVELRGENLLLLSCKGGQRTEIGLRNHPLGSYISSLVWEIRNPEMQKIASGMIPHDKMDKIRFTPKKDGFYVMGASAGSCTYSVQSANVPVGLWAKEGLSLVHRAERLYFDVPSHVPSFTVKARDAGRETVRLRLYDAKNIQAAEMQTNLQVRDISLKASPQKNQPGVWSLEITKADEGVLEDYTLWLDGLAAPVFSLAPEHVFRAGEAK